MRESRLIYGMGVNDLPAGVIGKGRAPFYLAWRGILERCYSERYQRKNPSYEGCSVSEDWLRLSRFKAWVDSQKHEGLVLDKDLLVPGNRIYSAETCVFVPVWVNSFLSNMVPRGGSLPMGVAPHCRRYKARYKHDTHTEIIGYYETPEQAHAAYRKYRLAVIKERIERYGAEPDANPKVTSGLLRLYVAEARRVDQLLLQYAN